MSNPAATLSSTQTEYTARCPLTIRNAFFFNLPVTDAKTAYTAKQKASRIERAPIFSISSFVQSSGPGAGKVLARSVAELTSCRRACRLRCRARFHLGLGFILRRALCLNFAGMEHAVRAQLAVGKSLRVVFECIRKGILAVIHHRQPHRILLEHAGSLMHHEADLRAVANNRALLH